MKEKIMRRPKIKNKYNLKPKDIEKAVILDYDRLHQSPFWRNDVVQAWCLTGGSGKGFYGDWIDSYWIGFVLRMKKCVDIMLKNFSILQK